MANGYTIGGLFVKSEYLVMATWASMGLLGYGVKRAISGPPAANDLPPITSSSKEEENFIKEFLKLAEADDAKSKAH